MWTKLLIFNKHLNKAKNKKDLKNLASNLFGTFKTGYAWKPNFINCEKSKKGKNKLNHQGNWINLVHEA